ncbi:penicillin-binding transpeptidase domain-containing protein [Nesterenkonia sandarakina]|uniref:Beta-lactamase n=1 Tax=Nesterenkonia sandarakina TaxID=272918 RepID=A0A7Z0E947_9MICC|nr:penicillin-binding transpeptidase domain-containing protein [Nesterenkonia sandarakina]NYJ16709.1 cell division protein FtsI/penicillin-binding protein 2 [Nesterenkonia sandarakina]
MSDSARSRLILPGVVSAAALMLLTSCSADPSETVEEAAGALASAVSSGDFSGLSFDSGDPETMATAVENLHAPLEDLAPEVEVGEIVLDEPPEDSPRPVTATVPLQHSWDLEELGVDGEAWTYETSAELVYDEETETWAVAAEPAIVLPDYTGAESIALATTAADRGRIMDDDGRAMVYNRDVVRLGIDKSQLAQDGEPADEDTLRSSAEALAELVGISVDPYVQSVLGGGELAFVEAITLRRSEDEVTADDVDAIPGALAIDDQMSLADSRDFAPLLLGRVGPVTAEALEADPSLSVGDTIGTSGIQASYEETLRGAPGLAIQKDGETLYSVEAADGGDVETTMVPRLQNLAQEIVDDQDTAGAVVAIRPSDGGVLAAASHDPQEGFVEIATQSSYAPGSTFKVVSSLAMLREGLTPDSSVTCSNQTTVHGQSFGNYTGFPSEYLGEIPFRDAVAVSCNTVFADAYDDVTSEEVHQAAVDLGITEETHLGVPARMGSVPQDSELNLHASNLFGQGVVEASTLGMATVAASIAAGGTVSPHLVVPSDESESQASGLSEEEAEDLRTLMTDTVNFGSLESLVEVPGEPVYAKTGTAEAGEGDDSYAHTWVIAMQGDLAVAIFLQEGEFGGSTNGPLLQEFLEGASAIL